MRDCSHSFQKYGLVYIMSKQFKQSVTSLIGVATDKTSNCYLLTNLIHHGFFFSLSLKRQKVHVLVI